MVFGVGIDLIQVKRIEKAIGEWGEGFLKRIYTPEEIGYCQRRKEKFTSFATRFAAKEAVRKALGGKRKRWREVEVFNDEAGRPLVRLLGEAKEEAEGSGIKEVLLTLSHDEQYALAQAIAIR